MIERGDPWLEILSPRLSNGRRSRDFVNMNRGKVLQKVKTKV